MKTILRALLSRGKFTVAAVVTALTLVTASAAFAGSGIGGVFNLGVSNSVNAITALTGSVAGPSMRITNNSANAGARALDLQVATGKAPMTVNSGTKVTNLNADKVDGKDSSAFFVGGTYLITAEFNVPAGLGTSIGFGCDGGDVALSGGYEGAADGTHIASNGPNPGAADSWAIQANNNSGPDDSIIARVRCADFPPTHIP
jgi:hypothetical protein